MTAELVFWLLVAHGVGDYVLQSDWMAARKTSRWWPAVAHGLTYGLPFIPLVPSFWAWLVIVSTHVVIDRYRLARYLVWAKNFLAPRSWWRPWADCRATGYPSDRPVWLTTWLMIIADNLVHVVINFAAVAWL